MEYTTRYPNVAIRKRIGLILEENGISDEILRPLLKSIKKTSLSSLNQSRIGKINKKWRLIINDL